jgi:hypothetical protein
MRPGQRLSHNTRQEDTRGRDEHKDATMNTIHNITKLAAKALLSGGLALTALGLATATPTPTY